MNNANPSGYLALVLHAHLPYVRHPEHERFLEEDWLSEAISETYIPLVQVFDNLLKDDVRFRITMTISPPLTEMFADPLLQNRYLDHINRLVDLCHKEVERTRHMPEFRDTAQMYLNHFSAARNVFANQYGKNLAAAFRKFQDAGVLEIITCGATHGFLPLMVSREAKRAQVGIAVRNYAKHFGRKPRGMWLPECGYTPGDDELLQEQGIGYFFLDTHGVLFGAPRPKYGVFAPVFCKSGVAAFARDVESSKQVWSAREGYPGDANYREFYRDLGYDGDFDYIKPYLHPDGVRRNLGIKYYKITGGVDLAGKQPYNVRAALETAARHAGNFMFNREQQMKYLAGMMDRKPIIVAPYDAELFGHWWFEGPMFLNYLIRKVCFDQQTMKLATCGDYLEEYRTNQVQQPTMSTWGAGGYNLVWINSSNQWLYKHMNEAEDRMAELAGRFPNADGLARRALNQAARELVLAQSSDWAFIITTNTMVPYAKKRFHEHIARFTKLYEDIRADRIDENWLREIEAKDNIFNEIDYTIYAGGNRA
jgi:1,4-alpha-glucan branching enzyme